MTRSKQHGAGFGSGIGSLADEHGAGQHSLPMGGERVLQDWDLATDEMSWSSTAASLFDCAPDELGTMPAWWYERMHVEDRERVRAGLQQVIDSDAVRWSVEYRLRLPGNRDPGGNGGEGNASYRSVLEHVFVIRHERRPIRVLGILALAGQHTEARAEPVLLLTRAEHSERQLRTLVESLPQLAWSATADGWIDFYNQRWYEYTGMTFEALEGWGWIAVHDPGDLQRVLRVWRSALDMGQPWEDELRLRRASDGMLRWHLARALPVHDDQGRIIRWYGTSTDIHDQRLALEQRSELLAREQLARQRAETANRAKDEFLAVLSHELRTPLNAILGWAHLLGSGLLDAAKQNTAIEKIEKNARLQGKLIEDLLDVARIISGKLELELAPLDVAAAVQFAIDAIRPTAEAKGIVLEFINESRLSWVRGNAERLQQVISNLLGNAIKFSLPGQLVSVRLRNTAQQVIIDIEDHGQGIQPDFLPHLFERFRQADSSSTRQHGGLGLGLSIVRNLVELHGGRVTAHSPGRGKGATFTVLLPALGQESLSGAEYQTAVPLSATTLATLAGVKVLGVDDESSARDILAEVLMACGATVTMAGSVREALQYVEREHPDVIVSDVAMPDIDGYGLVRRIRALPDPEAARTPIVALTAYASSTDRRRALDAGFDHHLAKPIEAVTLSQLLAEIVRERVPHESFRV